jgi:hypothetical protein
VHVSNDYKVFTVEVMRLWQQGNKNATIVPTAEDKHAGAKIRLHSGVLPVLPDLQAAALLDTINPILSSADGLFRRTTWCHRPGR